jgi:isopentenyl phosphate kinase
VTTVLKLGGSLVTKKDSPETVDDTALAEAAAAIGTFAGSLVVVHGGGSFGHHHAAAHGVTEADGSHDAGALTDIHGAMTDLSDAVVAALQEGGTSALPVRPLSLAHRNGGELSLPTDAVAAQLAEGFVPVLHGDVVAHAGEGATVLSGDEIVVALARSLAADRVGLCSGVPGVLDADGEVVERIEQFDDVAAAVAGPEGADVTGGMAGKVRRLLELSAPAHVFGLAALPAFLAGEAPGTAIRGGE